MTHLLALIPLSFKPWTWDYLTDSPQYTYECLGRYAAIFYGISAVALVASIVIYFSAYRRWSPNLVKMNLARRWSTWVFWLSLTNLIFFGLRWIGPTPLSEHIWTYLLFAADIGVGIYIFNWYQRYYNVMIANYEKRQTQRKYMGNTRRKV